MVSGLESRLGPRFPAEKPPPVSFPTARCPGSPPRCSSKSPFAPPSPPCLLNDPWTTTTLSRTAILHGLGGVLASSSRTAEAIEALRLALAIKSDVGGQRTANYLSACPAPSTNVEKSAGFFLLSRTPLLRLFSYLNLVTSSNHHDPTPRRQPDAAAQPRLAGSWGFRGCPVSAERCHGCPRNHSGILR
jgi:hypothetical protein